MLPLCNEQKLSKHFIFNGRIDTTYRKISAAVFINPPCVVVQFITQHEFNFCNCQISKKRMRSEPAVDSSQELTTSSHTDHSSSTTAVSNWWFPSHAPEQFVSNKLN